MLTAPGPLDAPGGGRSSGSRVALVLLLVAAMVYILALGWGLLTYNLHPRHAYLMGAVLCLLPTVWYGYGFLVVQEAEQDYGLLLSAGGWALLGVTFLIMHEAQRQAQMAAGSATAVATPAMPIPAILCTILAIICLLTGGVLAWHGWTRELRSGFGVRS